MGYNEITFDIDKLRSTKSKCDTTCETLKNRKDELIKKLNDLRQKWDTPSGREFFADQKTDWAAQIDSYVRITGAVSELLDTAIKQYEAVEAEAGRLHI